MMKHKQLINLFQLQCKIQNPINLKMNKKNLKNFTSQSPITQMCQNFMIFIYSSVIFFVVCFFLLPYILSIYKSIKFQSNIFLADHLRRSPLWQFYTLQANPKQLIEVYLVKNMKGNGGN